MTIPIMQVDAFTAEPFKGNPAGVCLLQEEPTEAWMQAVAAEMNLSETAFLLPRGAAEYSLRWFTPTAEVPLCGHATLASAHVLWKEKLVPLSETITFHSKSGKLTAARDGDWIRLDFPVMPLEKCSVPAGIADALGAEPLNAQRNQFPSYLVELESEQVVRALKPDFAKLQAGVYNRCIVTARCTTGECDFVSRFFAPGVGIDEDPVTGSAHCSLAPFWAEKLGKTEFVAHQASARGGVLKVRVKGDRVHLLGEAVTVIRGSPVLSVL